MRWTLKFRGFDRKWQEVTVEAATRAEAQQKLEATVGKVFSYASRDVRLEDETGRDVLHAERGSVNNFPRAKARS